MGQFTIYTVSFIPEVNSLVFKPLLLSLLQQRYLERQPETSFTMHRSVLVVVSWIRSNPGLRYATREY